MVWALGAVVTIAHAVFMRVPLHGEPLLPLVARSACCVGGIGCAIMSAVVLILRMSNTVLYSYVASQSVDDLCAFYQQHQCTGHYDSCGSWQGWRNERALCRSGCPLSSLRSKTC